MNPTQLAEKLRNMALEILQVQKEENKTGLVAGLSPEELFTIADTLDPEGVTSEPATEEGWN